MNNTATKKTQFLAVLVTLLLSGILPLDALAQDGHPMATGHTTVALEDGSLTVAFSAVGQPDGSAVGRIDMADSSRLPDQDVDGTGDRSLAELPDGLAVQAGVNCLVVDGDTAIVGGEVTHSNVARYVGKQVLLFVEDSTKLRGRFSWGFYESQDQVFCDSYPWAAYTPQKITEGSLQVQQ